MKTKKTSDLQFERDSIECPVTKFNKTGPIAQSPRLKKLHELSKIINEKHGGRFLYDITYSGDTSFETLTGTEICSHAVYVHPCNYTVRDSQILEASKDEDHNNIDILERLSLNNNLDKYRLVKQPFASKREKVVFLPGSNLFELMIDIKKVDDAVSKGAFVKPHPVTNHDVITFQKRRWGDAVLGHKISGYDVLKNCSEVYTTGSSEMSIYGVMLGKKVIDIERPQDKRNPAYRPIFNVILNSEDPYKALNNIFNSYKSGIFFIWDDHSKIDKYLNYSIAAIKELS